MLLTFLLLPLLGQAQSQGNRTGRYQKYFGSGTWYQFNLNCKSWGFEGLASITNGNEQSTVCSLCGGSEPCFVGGYQKSGEGTSGYGWIDGSDWTYVHWDNDGLNNEYGQGNPEDIMALDKSCRWHDWDTQFSHQNNVAYVCGGAGKPTPYPTNPPPTEKPTTPPPTPNPTKAPTEAELSKLCSQYHGDKGGCKSSQLGCSWDKKKEKCQYYTCSSFTSAGWKCDRKAAKLADGMVCYYDFANNVCTETKNEFPCAMFDKDKKGCKKKVKTQAPPGGCKWDKKTKTCANKLV